MAKIKADQIEVGAGPQHAVTKYGPGPGWELQASRIRDTGAVINLPGTKVQIGDFDIEDYLASTGIGFDDGELKTLAITGRRTAGSYGQLLMEYETAGQAHLIAVHASLTAHLRLRPAASAIDLKFNPSNQGTINLQGAQINLDAASVQKNQIPLGVIAEASLTAQTGNVGATLLATGHTAGLYRISYYLVTTASGTSGTVKASFTWIDLAAERTVDSAIVNFGTLADPATGTIIIRSNGTTGIGYTTTVTDPVGDPEYALYITLERLQ